MDNLRLHAVVARLVAWHNRHPLARRITAAQVKSVGYVALPFTAQGLVPLASPTPHALPPAEAMTVAQPEKRATVGANVEADAGVGAGAGAGAGEIVITVHTGSQTLEVERPAAAATTLRTRAAAHHATPVSSPTPHASSVNARAAAGAPRTLVCSEDFMAPLPLRRVLRWVHLHGLALLHDPLDTPVRHLPVDTALVPAGAGVGWLWVATAAVELGGQRSRLLLGGGDEPAVLGRRLWSRPRLLCAGLASSVLAAAAVVWLLPASPPVLPLPSPRALAEPAPLAVPAMASLASAASAPGPGVIGSASASASASAAQFDREPRGDLVDRPRLPGLLDDTAKAQARDAVAALRATQPGGPPAPSAAITAAAPVPTPLVLPAVQAASTAVLFGLSTRPLRTSAEAEQLQNAFQYWLGRADGQSLRVEMLPSGDDWRVVVWPYERRADAERARALLQSRGMRVELVDF